VFYLSVHFVRPAPTVVIVLHNLLLLYRVDQKMSTEHSVYSAHEAQEMLSKMKEMSKSVKSAETEKRQLVQVT